MTWQEKLKQKICYCDDFELSGFENFEDYTHPATRVNVIEIKDLEEILEEAEKQARQDAKNNEKKIHFLQFFNGRSDAFSELREILKKG